MLLFLFFGHGFFTKQAHIHIGCRIDSVLCHDAFVASSFFSLDRRETLRCKESAPI
jgi:hypothetical protein